MIFGPIHISGFRQYCLLSAWIGMILGFAGCDTNGDQGEELLAKVGNNTLKRKDLSRFMPPVFQSEEDSIRLTRQFIDRWVGEQVMTEQALGEIDGLQNQIEFKVKDYRNRLVLSAYYDYLIQTRLDTVVDSAAFFNYFEKHQEKYKADENYYQVLYVGTYVLDIRKPLQMLNASTDKLAWKEFKQWCLLNAFLHQADSSVWMNTSDLEELGSRLKYSGRLTDLRPGHSPISWTAKEADKPAQFLFKIQKMIPQGQTLSPAIAGESVRQGIIQERTRNILEAEKIRLVREAKDNGSVYVP